VHKKNFCEIFALMRSFQKCAVQYYQLHFYPTDPRCHGNEIWDKMGYNSAGVKDFREIFAPIKKKFPWMRRRMLPISFLPNRPTLLCQRKLEQNGL